jgi:hypothetical protein
MKEKERKGEKTPGAPRLWSKCALHSFSVKSIRSPLGRLHPSSSSHFKDWSAAAAAAAADVFEETNA